MLTAELYGVEGGVPATFQMIFMVSEVCGPAEIRSDGTQGQTSPRRWREVPLSRV